MSQEIAEPSSEQYSGPPKRRTVLMRRRGASHVHPVWTRHLLVEADVTVCGLQPALLHRAEEGDSRLNHDQIRDCRRCLQMASRHQP